MQSTFTDELAAIEAAIAQRIGQQKYKIWFKNSTSFVLAEGYLKIGVANSFIANWIESHFAGQIREAVESVTGQTVLVTFQISPKLSGHQRKQPQAEPAKLGELPAVIRRLKRPARHKLKLSLDNFVVGTSNQLAYNAAQTIVREEKSPFNPLFIHGGYGVGKTHLMQGICNAVGQYRPQTNWLYLSAEEFVNQFVLALKTKKLEAFRRRMRQTELLAIDDIHFLAGKLSTQEEFLHTFNSIDLAGKQIVLVSDAHPKLINQLSEKLVNRFISGMVVKIDAPDLKTRRQICRQFAQRLRKDIPDKIIDYISEHIHSNIREIEGAMLKVVAFCSLHGGKMTVRAAREILAEHVSRMDPIVHLSDIEDAVATYFGITPASLHSSKKDRTVSLARHFSMYLARKHTTMSSSEIGRCMGNKNHATVLLGCKKLDQRLKANAQLRWIGPNGNKISPAKTILAELEEAICK